MQGADLTQMTDKTAPRVTIMHHPDVRRSADDPEGLRRGPARAVPVHRAHQDADRGQAWSGADADAGRRVNDLLLPIVKGVGSERAYEMLTESLQTFGGSGFLQDYPIEQYIRDAKIDSLYEGTTAIQAQDFFFRKIVRDKGGAGPRRRADAGPGRQSRRTACEDRARAAGHRAGRRQGHGRHADRLPDGRPGGPEEHLQGGPGFGALPDGVGDLMIGWLLLRQAAVAAAALDAGATGDDKPFYEGKVAVASFFAKNFLPQLKAAKAAIENIDNDVMELDEAAF